VIAAVAAICEAKFGFTKAIFAPTLEEWSELVENNPFPVEVPRCLHAAVLADTPKAAAVDALKALAAPGEGLEIVGRVAYLHTPAGFGTSKLAEKFDKGIGVTNSARNWNTVLKLLELAKLAASE
jgi:uncharacterized protein (DUF1697 family)